MITPVVSQYYWKDRHEAKRQTTNQQRILRRRRARPAPRRKGRRKTARMHGTPIYIWKNGKVVAEKP